jgi:hypothetical protein
MNLLSYIEMKTERAKTHLDAFNAGVDEFLPKANTVTTKEDIKNSCCIRRTEFNAMPSFIGMELGEFLYCLRSGLDQLAWQLALPIARKDRPIDICFPVFERVINSQERRNFRKIVELFPDPVFKEIDAVQPYKGPDAAQTHPLWQLNKLCNIDKHWIIPFNSRGKRIFIPDNPAHVVRPLNSEDAIEVSIPLSDKAQFELDPHFPAKIELGEWDTDLAIPHSRLADIYGFVVCTVIPRFRKFDGPIIENTSFRLGDLETIYRR